MRASALPHSIQQCLVRPAGCFIYEPHRFSGIFAIGCVLRQIQLGQFVFFAHSSAAARRGALNCVPPSAGRFSTMGGTGWRPLIANPLSEPDFVFVCVSCPRSLLQHYPCFRGPPAFCWMFVTSLIGTSPRGAFLATWCLRNLPGACVRVGLYRVRVFVCSWRLTAALLLRTLCPSTAYSLGRRVISALGLPALLPKKHDALCFFLRHSASYLCGLVLSAAFLHLPLATISVIAQLSTFGASRSWVRSGDILWLQLQALCFWVVV